MDIRVSCAHFDPMARIARVWFFAASVLASLALVACSRHDQASASKADQTVNQGPPVQGDWVIERIDSDIDTLNPLTVQTDNGQTMVTEIFEGLIRQNNYTLKFEPCLAESWEISPDQLTYTFHLRHGVKWQDGEPFTAEDVKFTFDRVMDTKVDDAPLRSYFGTIKSCEIVDPYTIRITATARYFKTLEVIGAFVYIIPKHYFDRNPGDFNSSPFGRHPIGTGPYKFVRWDTGSQIVLERNDDYWGGPVAYPKRIVYEILEEPYVAAQLLKKGEIDLLPAVSPVQWEYELKGTRSMNHLRQIVYSYPAYTYFGFNLREPLFSDVRVRHAIDLLLPREEILQQIYFGKYATLASGYDPPSVPSYNHDVPPTPHDPALAQQLLTEAGWKNDHGDGILYKDGQPLTFTLLYPSGNSNYEKEAELLQEALARGGIALKLSRLEFAQLIAKTEDWKFDAVLAGWGTDINGDPFQIWASSEADAKNSSNFIGYKNPAADKLIAAGKLEYDADKRAAIYRQLHQLIHDDYPVCFLFNPELIMVVDDRFQNVNTFAPRPCFDPATWWVPRPLQKYGD